MNKFCEWKRISSQTNKTTNTIYKNVFKFKFENVNKNVNIIFNRKYLIQNIFYT